LESKLRTALSDIEDGIPIDKVANNVHWKDFEGLVAEILESKHFEVLRNFRMKKPTMEIDVVGKRLDVMMLIDCKHWKRMSHSNLKIIVNKQIKRAEQFIQNKKNVTVVPIIVTLYKEETSFVNGTPIVPIFQFSSFIDEFYGNLEYMNTIEK
jgi:Holliday junction resolvase-like predicted endonuclease|tara:strand:- start:4 stop:462 length:459 start_codon:yes stop_codon:yes gene_type:complete